MENNSFIILLVDDEEDILDFVGYNLRKEGYTVYTATNGRDAIDLAVKVTPHLVLLDVMMPEMDGVETCREIKRIKSLDDAIIVFFTARSEDFTQILSLDAGGDDYITKPIKPALLVSKVNSLLRRHKVVRETSPVFEAGDLLIDKEKYLVIREGKEIQLARKEFELLCLLASRPERVFTRDEILQKVWDDDVVVGERTIDVHIRKIREKTGSDHIYTLKGVGYKFVR
ncbi:MAG TPA: response regulator transcription factor [Bacteroidales bacterium]|nr:response regulator transcription factor [Bacteroidales bacterium]HPT01008.1 response regulator transcription factor [Bacteroidales bacterium]